MYQYPKILFIIIASVLFWLPTDAGIRFHKNIYEKGLKMAKKEGKLIFLDTYTQYCGPCKKMDRVFQEHEIGEFYNANFVNLKVDMNTKVGKKIHRKYDVFFVPTMLIMNADGMVIYRADKMMSADELIQMGNIALGKPHQPLAATNVPTTATVKPKPKKRKTIVKPTRRESQRTTAARSSYTAATTRPKPPRNDDYVTTISPETGATIRVRKSDIPSAASSSPSNDDEKILYVLGRDDGNQSPEVLYQEAYFRLGFMDGSHRDVAKEYLKTQDDWTTEKNLNFILDFLYKTDAVEFDYVIYNRRKFEAALGKDRVYNTIKHLVYQKLYQGFPKPTLDEAQALLSYVDPSSSRTQAYKYYLNRMYEEKKYKEYEKVAQKYISDYDKDDHLVLYQLAAIYAEQSQRYKKAIKLLQRAIDVKPKKVKYHHLLAVYYAEDGSKSKAKKSIQKAIQLATEQNMDAEILVDAQDMILTL